MSLNELEEHLKKLHESRRVEELIRVASRLSDIALFGYKVTDGERATANGLIRSIDGELEGLLRHDPVALRAYKSDLGAQRAAARQYGYGSLWWKVEEQDLEPAKVIEFIARSEFAEMLPDYLEMLDVDVIGEIRSALLQALSIARADAGETGIETLSRLANNRDPALTILLKGSQLRALRHATLDPGDARKALDDLGFRY